MAGPAFRQGGGLQQGVLRDAPGGVQGGDGEAALGQGAGFVEDHRLRPGQGLQIVAALDQDAALAGSADAAEEAQGHGDYQGAGAGDDQEDQRPVEPAGPVCSRQESGLGGGRKQSQGDGGQKEQRQGGNHHAGGVVPGEAGDEILAGGLLLPGVFHHVQDFGDGGLLAEFCDLYPEEAGLVHAAADHRVACGHIPGHGLAGEGGGVQGGSALDNLPVQGDPLAGADHHNGAHLHVLRVHLLQGAVLQLQVGGVGADVHEGGDGLAGPAHGVVLEELAGLVKEHDEDGLGVFAGGEGSHSGQGHEEVLVENLAVQDIADGLPEHVPADDGVGSQIQSPLNPIRDGGETGRKFYGNQQRRRRQNPIQHFPLFAGEVVHGKRLLKDAGFPLDFLV